MNILYVCRAYYPATNYGGPVTSLRRITRALKARGHAASVVCSNMASPGMFGRRLRAGRFLVDGIGVTYINTPLRFHWEGIGSGALDEVRHQVGVADVVHVLGTRHFLGAVAIGEARRQSRPYLIAPEGSVPPRSRNLFPKRLVDFLHTRRTFQLAYRIVATSEQEAQDLVAWGIASKQILILPPRADPIPRSMKGRRELRRAWSLPEDEPVQLWIGRINREKGLPVLLEALKDPRLASSHLALAGPPEDPALLRRLKAMAEDPALRGRVHFYGWVGHDAKAELYKMADLFVFPSRKENFGLAAAEAIVSGLPTILTDTCGVAHLIAGRGGVSCPYDASALAEAIWSLLSDPEKLQHYRAGTRDVAAELDWPPLVDFLERGYRQAIDPINEN